MNTLMTIWLISGLQIQLFTSDYACTQAVRALNTSGVVVLTLPDGFSIRARDVKCACAMIEAEGEPT